MGATMTTTIDSRTRRKRQYGGKTGRSVAVNFMMCPASRLKLTELAMARGLSKTALLEQLVESASAVVPDRESV
jgi:hypothetical protein